MADKSVDYSLYLVTDSTPAILGDRDLVSVVAAAVAGGVTVVQLRDKTSDTADLIRLAKELHKITSAAQVPLLINDRVDVALAAGVEGVHIGQDDLDLRTARRLLGDKAIIGVTANNEVEALEAARHGADYLGIGTVFATATKENSKSIIGTSGVRNVLSKLAEEGLDAKTVCIGGINHSNVQRVLFQSAAAKRRLDGVAIVSAIMASSNPQEAASELRKLVSTPPLFVVSLKKPPLSREDIVAAAPGIIKRMAAKKPLCHNMTNLVVQNFAANVVIAVGASPIMSNNGNEASDLANLGGSLVVNMGTSTAEGRANYLQAIKAYNAVGGPVLFDPVGAAATQDRREAVKALMHGGYFSVIKGNEGEIRSVSGAAGVTQHGVDSGAAQLSFDERVVLVKACAARERNVILLSGPTDIVSDGERTFAISNGHEYLGEITGSGCTLGATIASVLAVEREDPLLAVVTAMVMYEIAAERAAGRTDVRGPGSFVPALIDELYHVRQESIKGDGSWAEAAKIKQL